MPPTEPKPGNKTSEYQTVFLLFFSIIAMPILARHGVASEEASTVGEAALGFATAAYTLARTILKIVHRRG